MLVRTSVYRCHCQCHRCKTFQWRPHRPCQSSHDCTRIDTWRIDRLSFHKCRSSCSRSGSCWSRNFCLGIRANSCMNRWCKYRADRSGHHTWAAPGADSWCPTSHFCSYCTVYRGSCRCVRSPGLTSSCGNDTIWSCSQNRRDLSRCWRWRATFDCSRHPCNSWSIYTRPSDTRRCSSSCDSCTRQCHRIRLRSPRYIDTRLGHSRRFDCSRAPDIRWRQDCNRGRATPVCICICLLRVGRVRCTRLDRRAPSSRIPRSRWNTRTRHSSSRLCRCNSWHTLNCPFLNLKLLIFELFF